MPSSPSTAYSAEKPMVPRSIHWEDIKQYFREHLQIEIVQRSHPSGDVYELKTSIRLILENEVFSEDSF